MKPAAALAVLAACLACLAGLALPAAAQSQAAPVLSVTPTTGSVSLADNQTRDLFWTVRNSGPTGAATEVAFSGLPAGWRLQVLEPPSLSFTLAGMTPLAPGGSQAIHALLSPEPGAQPPDGKLTITATGTNQAGQSSTASATTGIVYVLPPPPPPPPPPNLWPAVAAGGLAALLLAAAGLYLFGATRVQLRLNALEVTEQPGDRATFLLLVRNRARGVRKVELRLRGLAAPWSGALMVPHTLLEGGAAVEIPLSVSIPHGAAAGEVRAFQVQARPRARYPWIVRRRLAARVLDVAPRVPDAGVLVQVEPR